MAKINYLNNKDMLIEIHLSKNSYCTFQNYDTDHHFDIILHSIKDVKPNIEQARKNRASRLSIKGEAPVLESDIKQSDLVFRVMTWEHIPVAVPTPKKQRKQSQAQKFLEELEPTESYIAEPDDLLMTPVSPTHVRVNFPPFQHYRYIDRKLTCVGKSHWQGNLDTGNFSKLHGQMTDTLARMFMKLTERYSTKGNWRGYCVDSATEALTQRGWLNIDQITESDIILSYNNEQLTWSSIKSIYRNEYDGLMHYVTSRSIDALITPNHKFITNRGLVEIELVKQSDQIIVMGNAVEAPIEKTYNDSFVELAGWIMTEGCYELDHEQQIKRITIYQNPTLKADRIRQCLLTENFKFTESGDKNLCFSIWKGCAKRITEVFPVKNLTMPFILSLTHDQRELLINTMIDGDGWKRAGNNLSYCQKDKEHTDLFQALLTLTGKKSNCHYITNHPSFGKLSNFYSINVFSKRGNKTRGTCLNFNGGVNNGAGINRNQGKSSFPNVPTVPYKGMVWCPETEYGCFVARRGGKVYLTGNTYNDEMRCTALMQLSQVGLQFDESKSNNPFAYYSSVLGNAFTRVLNLEKKNQSLRDDILEQAGLMPSFTRQEKWHQANQDDPTALNC